MQTLRENTTLQSGKYRIIKVLGQGGFGITYLAEQVMLGRKVAIKEFFYKECCDREEGTSHVTLGTQSNRETVQRFMSKFLKEARTISQLDHPNIIKIHDIFEENNTAYYVMEYIEGENLSELVKRQGALSEVTAVGYIKKVADALAYIHAQNINHLDVKPGNIMLRQHDQQIVLIDFGLSKQYDDVGSQTSSTPIGVSQGYAPIEQYRAGGVAQFSPQTDIYSLGATLYWLVVGKTPPPADEVLEGLPPMPPNVSASVKKAIESAMKVNKKDRPQSINEFMMCMQPSGLCNEEKAIRGENSEDTLLYKENSSDTISQLSKATKFQERSTNLRKILIIILIGIIVLSTVIGIWIMRHQLFTEKNEIVEDAEDYSIEGIAKTLSQKTCRIEWQGFSEGLIMVSCNHKKGFMDKRGVLVIPCIYEEARSFSDGLASVKKEGKWGFIDKNGKEVITYKYDYAESFSEGCARVTRAGKSGFIDKDGNEFIPCKYDYAFPFSEGIARVENGGKYGFIDKNGEEITPCRYEIINDRYPGDFSNGLARVKRDGKWGFIDKSGKEVIPCQYKHVESFSEGLARVKKTSKSGFIDTEGYERIPCEYDYAEPFSEGLACVIRDEKQGLINKDGIEIVPCKYEMPSFTYISFSEGLASVRKNGKWGFIDKDGNEIIPCQYEDDKIVALHPTFSEGLASVKKAGKWGFIDKSGNVVIPFQYDVVSNFSEGIAVVKNKGKMLGLIDKNGKCTYDYYQRDEQ